MIISYLTLLQEVKQAARKKQINSIFKQKYHDLVNESMKEEIYRKALRYLQEQLAPNYLYKGTFHPMQITGVRHII